MTRTTTVALAVILLAGPALAQRPLPGYGAGAKPAARAVRVRKSLPGYVEKTVVAAPAPIVGADEELRDSVSAGSTGLREGLRAKDASARMAAVLAAGRPNAKESIPYLAGALLRVDEDLMVRSAAALAIARIGDPSGAPFLAFALNDSAPQIRQVAALALSRLPADQTTRRLVRALRHDRRWQVRYAAAIALGHAAPARAARALSTASLSDPDQRVRLQAARALETLNASRSPVVAPVR